MVKAARARDAIRKSVVLRAKNSPVLDLRL